MKKTLLIIAAFVLLAGCSPNQSVSETKKENRDEPAYGGTLKIYSYNPDTFNPLYTQNKANAQMLMLLFDTLIRCDESQIPTPFLASGFGVSADGLVWTVSVRDGISWHDGSAFTANDVAGTLNAVRNSPYNSPYKNNLQNVSSIDSYGNIISITLKTPQTNFINLLEIPIVKAADANTYNDFGLNGTGQFVFAEKTNKIIYLHSNKGWWGESTPYIEGVEVYMLPDKSTSVYAYEAKEIDTVTTDMQNRGNFSGSAESNAVDYNSGSYNFLSFNLGNEYLGNYGVRCAIAHAISKQRIFEEVMLSHGALTDTFLHPDWWVYNDNVTKYGYDPKLAITILSELQIKPSDIKISITVNNDNKIKLHVADIIKEELKNIGIDADVAAVSWDSFISGVSKGAYDMYLGEINYSPEINPQYVLQGMEQPLCEQLQRQTTNEGRKELYDSIQRKYADFLPAIPLYFEAETLLYHSKIKGPVKPSRSNMFSNVYEWYIGPVR